jgi:osmotically-inducible protein OsmY
MPPGDLYRRDEVIHERVNIALRNRMGPAARHIAVRVSHGNVFLSGRVRDARDRDRARYVADSVRGVRDVYARQLRVGYY